MRVTKFVNTVFNSNTYIIDNGKLAIVVDIGDFYNVDSFLNANDLQLEAAFLTHVHFDYFLYIAIYFERLLIMLSLHQRKRKRSFIIKQKNFSKYHDDSIEIS